MIFGNRKTIGVFFSGFDAAFSETLYRTIHQHLDLLDADFLFFSTISYHQNQNQYDIHENRLFDLVPFEDLDGAIVIPDSYIMQGFHHALAEKLFSGTKGPIVTLRSQEGAGSHIFTDETEGIRPLIRHLLDIHRLTRLCFVTGYPGHPDAERRLACFREEMAAHDLPIPDEAIFQGDMWVTSGPAAYHYFYEEHHLQPEAIICANDYMAKGVMEALQEHGICVPEDVIVTGFDNVVDLGDAGSTLTTIAQDYETMILRSLELLREQLALSPEKRSDQDISIPGRLVLGQSCGCFHPNETYLNQYIARNVHTRDREQDQQIKTTYLNIDLSACDTFEDLHRVLVHHMGKLAGLQDFYLCLFADEESGGRCLFPEKMTDKACLVSVIENQKDAGMPMCVFNVRKLLPDRLKDHSQPRIIYMSLLHHLDQFYGYSLFCLNSQQTSIAFFQYRNVMISGALRNIFLQRRLREMYEERRILSITDPLTHTLNRRGLEEALNAQWSALCSSHTPAAFFSFDMDRMKYINDHFGHPAGDRALQLVVQALTEVLGSDTLIARTGGDEFLAFLPNCEEAEAASLVEAFEAALPRLTAEAGLPYSVSCSPGFYVLRLDSASNFEQCVLRSDQAMYVQKALHRAALQEKSL